MQQGTREDRMKKSCRQLGYKVHNSSKELCKKDWKKSGKELHKKACKKSSKELGQKL